jgi:hypothetical protein
MSIKGELTGPLRVCIAYSNHASLIYLLTHDGERRTERQEDANKVKTIGEQDYGKNPVKGGSGSLVDCSSKKLKPL